MLASAGHRVVVPYLRGYGATRFLAGETLRNGQPSALAVDAIALMDALKIEKATVAGFDWGARTANIVAALWPERCKALVSVSGYLIGSPEANEVPLPPYASPCNAGHDLVPAWVDPAIAVAAASCATSLAGLVVTRRPALTG